MHYYIIDNNDLSLLQIPEPEWCGGNRTWSNICWRTWSWRRSSSSPPSSGLQDVLRSLRVTNRQHPMVHRHDRLCWNLLRSGWDCPWRHEGFWTWTSDSVSSVIGLVNFADTIGMCVLVDLCLNLCMTQLVCVTDSRVSLISVSEIDVGMLRITKLLKRLEEPTGEWGWILSLSKAPVGHGLSASALSELELQCRAIPPW